MRRRAGIGVAIATLAVFGGAAAYFVGRRSSPIQPSGVDAIALSDDHGVAFLRFRASNPGGEGDRIEFVSYLDPDRRQRWQIDLPVHEPALGYSRGAIAMDEDLIVTAREIEDHDGPGPSRFVVDALSREDGALRWQRQIVRPPGRSSRYGAFALLQANRVIVSGGVDLTVLDRQRGSVRWSYRFGHDDAKRITAIGDRVLVETGISVHVFDADGDQRRFFALGNACVTDRQTFLISEGGRLEEYRLDTLEQRRSVPVPGVVRSFEVLGCVSRPGEDVVIGAMYGSLMALGLSPTSDKIRWRAIRGDVASSITSLPVRASALRGSRFVPIAYFGMDERYGVASVDLERHDWLEPGPSGGDHIPVLTTGSPFQLGAFGGCLVLMGEFGESVFDPVSGVFRGRLRHGGANRAVDASLMWLGSTLPPHRPYGWAVVDPCSLKVQASDGLDVEVETPEAKR